MSKPRDHCPCHSNSAASTPRTPVGGPPRHMPVAGELPPLPRRYSASCPISQSLAPPTIRHRLSARDPQRRDRPGRSTRLTITPPLSSGPAAGQRAIDRARDAGAGRVAWSLRRRGAAAGPRKRAELAAGTYRRSPCEQINCSGAPTWTSWRYKNKKRVPGPARLLPPSRRGRPDGTCDFRGCPLRVPSAAPRTFRPCSVLTCTSRDTEREVNVNVS